MIPRRCARVERLLYLAEYKRRQSAPGVKVGPKNFGRDRRYPIVNRFRDQGLRGANAGRVDRAAEVDRHERTVRGIGGPRQTAEAAPAPPAILRPDITDVAGLEAPVEASMQKVAFKAGETIIREGDEGDTAFFIVSGAVDVAVGRGDQPEDRRQARDRRSVWRNVADRPGPRSATVTAACDTECLAASYQDFVAAIEENPERAVGFMKTLVRRLRKMNELLETRTRRARGFARCFWIASRPPAPPKRARSLGRCCGDLRGFGSRSAAIPVESQRFTVVFCS